ncbi:BQ2448_2914 [Microbotryum intermedium]|uniref:BQ2448_2914 protein n=1 Tax=Microbotryum intermedium TaxID=269621 RepID=A0A238FJS4_9BASI|nr:BQ2448_2914 [Microbotryum intermedium]
MATPVASYGSMHSAASAPPPPPLSMSQSGSAPPQQGPSVAQILTLGHERNHAADQVAHHPRIESLVKLGKEAEATWLQIGRTAEAVGDPERAVASYEAALRHNAFSLVALSQIAAICRSKEEFKKAAEYFGRALAIAPESGDIWGALGHCFLMIDDLKKAYCSYQQALYYMPNPQVSEASNSEPHLYCGPTTEADHISCFTIMVPCEQEPKLWYGIGILYDRYGSLENAEDAFASVIRLDPSFEKANEIFFRLGIIYKQQRKSQQSLEVSQPKAQTSALELALKWCSTFCLAQCFRYILTNPPHPLTEIDIWFQIGHVYEQQKDLNAAKESYERVLAENPSHAKVLQQLGGLYHRSRASFYNPEVSVQILLKSLESDPNDPFSWYLLGRAYMTVNNFSKAYEAYQQAVYRDGKNPAFWCSIGVLYYNITQYHDALDAYSRAIRIHPYLAEVWFNLGALYESCNDQMTDAIDAYQRTLQLDPGNTIVSTRLREIRAHQETGSPLGTPPEPKDISPSSLSWSYATGSGGAPTQIAQAGLGPDLSPSLSRANGHGPGSPHNGRFDGPPPTNGARPLSTDPHRDDRRRASGHGGHQSPAHGNTSPRSTHRLSGSSQSQLPQMKSNHDTSPSADMASQHRRRSPPSPRFRLNGAECNTPGHYPNISSHPYGRASEHESMEWERARAAPPTNGRGSAQGSHPHPYPAHHAPPPPPPQHPRGSPPIPPMSREPAAYDRQTARSPSSARADERGPGYPTPYGYAPYPPAHPAASNDRSRYPPFGGMDDRSRGAPRPTSAGSPRGAPSSAAASLSPTAPPSTEKRGATPASSNAGSKGGNRRDEPTSSAFSTTPSGKKEGTPSSGGRGRKSDTGVTVKKERKSAGPKSATESTKGGRKAHSSAGSTASSPTVASPISASASTISTATPLAPVVPVAPVAPTREIDDDYDEGVDALMGLSRSVPSSAAPASEKEITTDEEAQASLNPRKRAFDEMIPASESTIGPETKKTKPEDAPAMPAMKASPPPPTAASNDAPMNEEVDELAPTPALASAAESRQPAAPAVAAAAVEVEVDELATPPPSAAVAEPEPEDVPASEPTEPVKPATPAEAPAPTKPEVRTPPQPTEDVDMAESSPNAKPEAKATVPEPASAAPVAAAEAALTDKMKR